MKFSQSTLWAALMTAFLGVTLGVPAYAASDQYGDQPGTMQDSTTQQPAEQPAQPEPNMGGGTEQNMQKSKSVCARLDTNHDGYISRSEFKASGQTKSTFSAADTTHRGKLTVAECDEALSKGNMSEK